MHNELSRALVHDHCRQLLLNLLIAVAAHNDHLTVARLLLNSQTSRLGLGLPIPPLLMVVHIFTGKKNTIQILIIFNIINVDELRVTIFFN